MASRSVSRRGAEGAENAEKTNASERVRNSGADVAGVEGSSEVGFGGTFYDGAAVGEDGEVDRGAIFAAFGGECASDEEGGHKGELAVWGKAGGERGEVETD